MFIVARWPRPGAWFAVAAAIVGSGCGLLLDTDPAPVDGDAAMDSGIQVPNDAQTGDAVIGDAVVGDTGPTPVGRVEPLPACGDPPDPATIALYRMGELTGGRLLDETGAHHGDLYETVTTMPGPAGCGMALDTRDGAYAVVPHDRAFQLTRGAVDLWVYFVALPGPRANCSAFLSRDAKLQDMAGHLTLYLSGEGRIGVRLQTASVADGGLVVFSSEPYSLGTWHHVGMNFGPEGVALFIDGAETMGGSAGACSDVGTECTVDCTTGIEGNANPWVLGAGATESGEGDAVPPNLFFEGAIDELRISSTHRDFAGAGP